MDNKLKTFHLLSQTFKEHGYLLYLVGGAVRDYLWNIPLTDMDVVTDATPEQMKQFLIDADYTFSRFGSVKFCLEKCKFDITTMREEEGYIDSRHPTVISFTTNVQKDVMRRDFTINALYLNDKGEVLDFIEGKNDLNNHLLKMIGDPQLRIKEDPLRIIRAARFVIDYDLNVDNDLAKAIIEYESLLDEINIDKIKQDIKKIKCLDKNKIFSVFRDFHITRFLDVVE